MFRNSILQKTGQMWKLIVGLLALGVGFLVMVWGLKHLRAPDGFTFTFGGLAIITCAFVVMCAGISCPACGMRWLWTAIKTQEHSQWLNWLRTQPVCPRCGYDVVRGR
jgi:hypothetical protein